MKANYPLCLASLALPLIVAACAAPSKPPPVVVVAPPPPAPPPPPRPRPPADWRDAAQTPGTWRWTTTGGNSIAQFVGAAGSPLAVLQCNRTLGSVWLARPGIGSGPVMVIVRTTGAPARVLSSDDSAGPGGWIGVRLAARDALLDAIAFSRGRFALETAGLETLYLPAWPELTRVVQDCR
ncbi:MAG: hypothetical protein ACKOPG_09975 [Novosphingobium sp.]